MTEPMSEERLREVNYWIRDVLGEVDRLKAENARLRYVLKMLYDEQNGPPRRLREMYWDVAMQAAEEALGLPSRGDLSTYTKERESDD